jgi:Tfp pilus assembly protein PilN
MRAVNLIPAEHRSGASVGAGQSQGAVYAVLGMLAGVALLAVLYGSAHRQISSRQGEAARLTAQAQQAQAAAAGLAPYTSFVKMRAERTEAVSTLVDTRFDWAHTFHEFGRVLPLGVSISSLEGTVGTTTGATLAPAPTPATSTTPASSATPGASASTPAASTVASATPAGSVPAFTIGGCATTQREVAVMLERLRLIDGVAAVTLASSTKGASAGAGAGTGTCPLGAPVFTAHIEFDPLPAAPAKSSSTATVANTTSTTGTSTK